MPKRKRKPRPVPTLKCRWCRTTFTPDPLPHGGRWPQYCSPDCRRQGQAAQCEANRKPRPTSAAKTRSAARPPDPEPMPPDRPPRHTHQDGRIGSVITSEVIYEDDETEFLAAMERFKKAAKTKFPTWSDALHVLKSLGYRKAG